MRKLCWCGGKLSADGSTCLDSLSHDPSADGSMIVDRLYLAGPMSGYPDCNYPAFNEVEEHLKFAGFEVVNPRLDGEGLHYVELLRRDLAGLLDCQGVAVLPGWEFSTGARNEVQVAGVLRMPVLSPYEWLERGPGQTSNLYG